MAGPRRATGHVIHASLSDGALHSVPSTAPLNFLSSGTYELIILQNFSTGRIRIGGSSSLTASTSTGNAAGVELSSDEVLIWEHVVPFNKLWAISKSGTNTLMSQTAT